MLDMEIEQYHNEMMASGAENQQSFEEALDKKTFYRMVKEQLKSGSKWVCTNGKDPKALSNQDYVKEFGAGPCSPSIFIPGIAGSKLIVQIDCKTFRDNNRDAFNSCGWLSCGALLPPRSEYQIWIPAIVSPMTLVSGLENNRNCFSALLGFDTSKVMEGGQLLEKKGLKISILGDSPKTKSKEDGNCGWDAISELGFGTKTSEFNGLTGFLEYFENAGYKNGVSLQALPYDWRLDFQKNELKTRFPNIVNELYNNWGKKTTIFAHSFGNYQAVLNLSRMSQQDKDTKIARYIGLAPPYLGSPQTARMIFGLDNTFAQDVGPIQVGITAQMFKSTIGIMKGYYNLFPKDTFRRLKDKKFMQALEARVDSERRGIDIKTNTVVDLLPGPREKCVPGFKTRDEFCKFGLHDLTESGSIQGTPVNKDTIEDLLDRYASFQGAKEIYQSVKSDLFEVLTNPGVQTSVIFTSTTPTEYKFTYTEDPKIKTSHNQYVAPNSEEKAYGDKLVLTTSALTAALKWADDFESNQPGAYPVNMIEMCSIWNRRESIFEPGTKSVNSSAYFGYDCACGGTEHAPADGTLCDHMGFIGDPKFHAFSQKSAQDGVPQIQSATTEEFANRSNEWLSDYENKCLLLTNN